VDASGSMGITDPADEPTAARWLQASSPAEATPAFVKLDEASAALVAAAREALVNAAKHSQTTEISLFGEIEPEQVSVFVKDRGVGFDIDEIGDDRQGVRGSIIGRVQRHGGTVRVSSTPGAGTEIEIRMPR